MIMQCVPCYMFILNMKFNFFSFASGTRKSKGYLPLKVCLRSMEEQKKPITLGILNWWIVNFTTTITKHSQSI